MMENKKVFQFTDFVKLVEFTANLKTLGIYFDIENEDDVCNLYTVDVYSDIFSSND